MEISIFNLFSLNRSDVMEKEIKKRKENGNIYLTKKNRQKYQFMLRKNLGHHHLTEMISIRCFL